MADQQLDNQMGHRQCLCFNLMTLIVFSHMLGYHDYKYLASKTASSSRVMTQAQVYLGNLLERILRMDAGYTVCGKTVEIDTKGQDGVQVYDRDGQVVLYQRYRGVLYSRFYEVRNLQAIQNFKMCSDDIFFVGYYRTGTHWTYELLGMILSGAAESIPMWKGEAQLENTPASLVETIPRPRVIHTHLIMSHSPISLLQEKCKLVYTLRDPRDVALSLHKLTMDLYLMTCYKGTFQNFFYLFLEGKVDGNGYFEHMLDIDNFLCANKGFQMHVMVYEETLKEPVKAIRNLSEFLGRDSSIELCQDIADKCAFETLAKNKERYSWKINGEDVLFGKGVSGRWRQYFTDEMLEDYYRVYEEKMAGSRFYRKEYARPYPDENDARKPR